MNNILTADQINKINIQCKNYNISNYTINSDRSIDVNGDVNLSDHLFKKIPIKFNKVNGDFNCKNGKITTLKNSPKEVSGEFNVAYNRLLSLQHCPVIVGTNFIFEENSLMDLKYFPEYIGGFYTFFGNNLERPYYTMILEMGDKLPIFIKYMNYYEVWIGGVFNEDNYNELKSEIEDGLL